MQRKPRSIRNIIFLLLGIIIIGGLVYWQVNKKALLRTTIQKEVLKGTDSLYRITYDSSYIDEVSGDLRFFNISMQSDSLLENLYNRDSNLTATIFKIHIKQLNILGADIPSFLNNTSVSARQIDIIEPKIEILQTGKKNPGNLSKEDSLALYERITGKFNSLRTDRINIIDAEIRIVDAYQTEHTHLRGLNIGINNFLIDSTQDYDNLIHYFIDDTELNVSDFYQKLKGADVQAKNVSYRAKEKLIEIEEMEKKDKGAASPKTRLSHLRISGISTQDFIRHKKMHADSIATDGGIVTLYINPVQTQGQTTLEISNSFFESIWVKNISIGNTNLYVYNTQKPNKEPLVLKNFTFSASGIQEIIDGKNLKKLIATSDWKFSAAGLQIETTDKKYTAAIGPFLFDKKGRIVKMDYISLQPNLSEAAFVRTLKEQKDIYNLRLNQVVLKGVEVETLLLQQKLIAESANIQPLLKIFNDRTVPYSTQSKVGKYPQQQLMRMKFPIYIKKVHIHKGHVSYRERGRKSKQIGNVFFSNISGEINNLTNIPSYVAKNNQLKLQASANFMGAGALKTNWNLILNSPNGSFSAMGNCGPFDASVLSKITEPLGMAAITDGKIQRLNFNMTGNDFKSEGTATLLYENIKMNLLKSGSDSTEDLEKKTLASALVNVFMKSNNPNNGKTRIGKIDFERDVYKSFFNLLWKSIFDAVKDIAM